MSSVFDAPKPALSDAAVAALLHRHWGLSGVLKPLVSERDQNVLVQTATQALVLKIANRAEDAGHLALQNAALAHIAQVDPTLGVPRLVPAADGAAMVMDGGHALRLMTWLPGPLWSAVPASPGLLHALGDTMGRLSRALQGFGHPGAYRAGFLWNLDTVQSLRPWLAAVAADHRAMVTRILDRHAARVQPRLMALRGAVLHQDANDNNLVVDEAGQQVTGLIDFGDMSYGRQVNELAVTLAYALLDCADLYATARPLIAAYAAQFPLIGDEAGVLFDLVAARLAASVCISSQRAREHPDNAYLTISQAPALRLLDRLDRTNPTFLSAFARHAAGLDPVPAHDAITGWLASPDCHPHGLFDIDLNRTGRFVLSLAKAAPGMQHAGDPVAHWGWLQAEMTRQGAGYAIGLYGESREVYRGDQFRTAASPEWRSQHLGIDIFIADGTPLHAPLPGRVLSVVDNAAPYDYGPTVILEHQAGTGGPLFWTLYGHLSRATLTTVQAGQRLQAGDLIGFIGDHTVNGGWSPHLHFQIITDRLDLSGEFPGVGQPSLWPVWQCIVPDPNLILRLAPRELCHRPQSARRPVAATAGGDRAVAVAVLCAEAQDRAGAGGVSV